MSPFAATDYVPEHISHNLPPIKTEASASPDLLSPSVNSLQQYQFNFHAPNLSSSHASLPLSRHSSEPHNLSQNHIYRFGSTSGYNIMSTQASWPSSPTSAHVLPTAHSRMLNGNAKHELAAHHHSVHYAEDYDDVSELVDITSGSNPNLEDTEFADPLMNSGTGKNVRRRSSKACDQCRKSKCKCERTAPGEPCKSCILLGTACTFLGPSRKRGPPKGYIDAIEARLHQTEALLGIMISSNDPRARSLLRDIGKDSLAKEIINRVDNSPYGVKGRKQDGETKPRVGYHASSSESSPSTPQKTEQTKIDITSMHPSHEWQDRVSAMLSAPSSRQVDEFDNSAKDGQRLRTQASAPSLSTSRALNRPALRLNPSISATSLGRDESSPGRRTRRRVGTEDIPLHAPDYVPSSGSVPDSSASGRYESLRKHHGEHRSPHSRQGWSASSTESLSSDDDDELLTGAIGQLSLNEDEQVRYHGKASGLHLLGNKERVDGRNEGGIWRFPKARVWPPLPPSASTVLHGEDEYANQLPAKPVQDHLLDLYFRFVHPSLPLVHKQAFLEAFNAGNGDSPRSPELNSTHSASPFNQRRRRAPTILLLAMFAIAARYSEYTPKPTDASMMWEAGDEYLNQAKVILDRTYAASCPSTCQALLLMGYREIGIGAMAQAWTYIGMAIRMAQDLGMHRSADGWARVDLGGRLFGERELHERKRIWFTCVIMDKYVSTYIGRPLMICEKDFDTTLPSEDDPEELEEITPSIPKNGELSPTVPGRIISCFNASARLSGILSKVVQDIYAVRPVSSRHIESKFLEASLDKWYIELPDHLRYELGSLKRATPLPHVLTLHMQYWCAALLLHRPFIRNALYNVKNKESSETDDVEGRALAEKSYELCARAANHITSLATIFSDAYTFDGCANFLCYYVFTASIMHVTSLTTYPSDPQARIGLNKCMDVLHSMEILWPSAGRALELLRGSKVNQEETNFLPLSNSSDRRKRSAEQPLNDSDVFSRNNAYNDTSQKDFLELRSPYPSQYTHQSTYISTGNVTPAQAAPPLNQASYVSPSLDRWPLENANNNSYGFTGTLSTSVLPQLYSTGLIDDRTPTSSMNRVHLQIPDQIRQSQNPNRYPQYWNDFSTYSQLGPAYGGYHESVTEPTTTHHHPPPPSPSSQVYLAEPYSVYS